jgi:hypothetical protein
MSKAVKIKVHNMMLKTFVVFENGTWAMAEMDMIRLGAW